MTGSEAAEEEALGPNAVAMFAIIDRWVKATSTEPPPVELGSPLAGDARKSPGLQVANAAWAGIVHSVDHLHALRALVVQAQTLNLGAPYTLMRSAMENAAIAAWLLEPPQRSERLRRCLKLALYDAWEEGNAHKLMPARALEGKRSAEERKSAIRVLAAELGLSGFPGKRFTYEEAIRAAAKTTFEDEAPSSDRLSPEDRAVLVWRLYSAFAHGRPFASLSWLDREVVSSEGSSRVLRLTGGIQKLMMVADVPVKFTGRARQLYEQRRRSPYSTA
jgi:hypothetical protein